MYNEYNKLRPGLNQLRGVGIAIFLIQKVINTACSLGFTNLLVIISKNNIAGVRFIEKIETQVIRIEEES